MDATLLKQQAAERAVEFIESGMIVGLGHGTTAIWATRKMAELCLLTKPENAKCQKAHEIGEQSR